MIFSYGSRRLRTNAFSFCRAAVLANSEISSVDCRLSFGSPVHWRMIFRRASRCFFITSCIGTLLEVDYSGSHLRRRFATFRFLPVGAGSSGRLRRLVAAAGASRSPQKRAGVWNASRGSDMHLALDDTPFLAVALSRETRFAPLVISAPQGRRREPTRLPRN